MEKTHKAQANTKRYLNRWYILTNILKGLSGTNVYKVLMVNWCFGWHLFSDNVRDYDDVV